MLAWVRRRRLYSLARRFVRDCTSAFQRCQSDHPDWEPTEQYVVTVAAVRPDWSLDEARGFVERLREAEDEWYGRTWWLFQVVYPLTIAQCVGFVIERYGVEGLHELRGHITGIAFDAAVKGLKGMPYGV